jgi:flagellar protein FlhE
MKHKLSGHTIGMICLCLLMHEAGAQLRVDRTLSITPAGTNESSAIDKLSATAARANPANNANNANPPAGSTGVPRAGGSYVSESMGASIVAKNANYATRFNINLNVPPGSRITQVTWRYAMSMKPAGFEAVLCWDEQQPCWNVTNENSGSTTAFNGKDASRPFTLFYRVQGSGPLGTPALGRIDQLVVNYDLP